MSNKFSERYGLEAKSMKIQTNSVDEELRTSLWNVLLLYIFDPLQYQSDRLTRSRDLSFFALMWHEYFTWPLDQLPFWTKETIDTIRDYFFQSRWYEVYDLLEYIIENYRRTGLASARRVVFKIGLNESLEQGQSAYRLVAGKFVPITSEEEIREIEQATSQSIPNVREHIKTAMTLLSDRQNPDYRNSIKESISAVEAVCRLVTGEANMKKALSWLERNSKLHPAMKNAFSSLYGWTSDDEGIRHALMDEPTLSFAEAKLMLVMCSTFVNYLLEKASQAGTQLHE